MKRRPAAPPEAFIFDGLLGKYVSGSKKPAETVLRKKKHFRLSEVLFSLLPRETLTD
jgi:hypothetical protein